MKRTGKTFAGPAPFTGAFHPRAQAPLYLDLIEFNHALADRPGGTGNARLMASPAQAPGLKFSEIPFRCLFPPSVRHPLSTRSEHGAHAKSLANTKDKPDRQG